MKTRIQVLLFAITVLAIAGSLSAADADGGLKLGMQSYTLRRLKFDQAIELSKKHGMKYIQLFPNHLGPQMPPEELKAKKEALENAGLIAYTFGVANNELADPTEHVTKEVQYFNDNTNGEALAKVKVDERRGFGGRGGRPPGGQRPGGAGAPP